MGTVFQQNNVPIHKAKKTDELFYDSEIELLDRLLQRPDLSLFKNLCTLLDKEVSIMYQPVK
ncbi:hypothetical protein WN55_03730 [Dufourea novaeangliae]|uniref:Uncharacterized protein n=1 Tax=Dufourea novaeangliae TaxID=178035 RepID=A0A154PK31_DUFNO|nr:hypothetical protein WN55_03730 [Dufourea novaeangliae]